MRLLRLRPPHPTIMARWVEVDNGSAPKVKFWRSLEPMKKIAILSLALLTFVKTAIGQKQTSCSQGFHTLYSQKATTLDAGFVRLVSPDGKKTLLAERVENSRDSDESHMRYTVRVAGKSFSTRLLGFNGEVAWSPDSKAFAVSETEGGGSLGERVYVFYADDRGMRKLDVSRPIERAFGHPVRCDIPIDPNTAFISWVGDSTTLLVAAEVVPVSVCSCAGTYRVYEMKLPALTIAHIYSQAQAKKQLWNMLGCELRDADDRCIEALEGYYRPRR